MSVGAVSAQGFDPGPPRRGVDRRLLGGVAIAALGHLALFGILSLAWRAPTVPVPQTKPVEVSLVEDVALEQRAPSATEAPAQSRAPEQAAPEDAAPPAPAEEVAPDPAPPVPQPKAASVPKPEPKPVPKPVPAAKPVAKPIAKPVPAPKPPAAERAARPDKVKAAPAKPAAAPAPSKVVAATKGAGTKPTARAAKPTGSLLDDDFRKGLTQTPSRSTADVPPAAVMDGKAAADIGSAIRRQVQPCADRQVNPGPGASRILVPIRLQLNKDGSLAARPTVAGEHGGVDDENRRYVDAVDRNAINTFTACAPLKGLPPELYDVPHGWKTFILRYKLPG